MMSALPPGADIALHRSECPLCAKSGHFALRQLFDHLGGAAEQRQRESDAEHLGSLEVGDQTFTAC